MKVDISGCGVSNEIRAVPANHRSLIDKLEGAKDDVNQFVAFLSDAPDHLRFTVEPVDLFEWISVLNVMDSVLGACVAALSANNDLIIMEEVAAKISIDMEDSSPSVPTDCISAAILILKFSESLLYNAQSKSLYNSFEHLKCLFSAKDDQIVTAVLRVLAASSSPTALGACILVEKKEQLDFNNYGSIVNILLSLVECVSHNGIEADQFREKKFAADNSIDDDREHEFSFDFSPYLRSEIDDMDVVTPKVTKLQVTIKPDTLVGTDSLGVIYARLVQEHQIPEEARFALLWVLRFLQKRKWKNGEDLINRWKLLALTTLFRVLPIDKTYQLCTRNYPDISALLGSIIMRLTVEEESIVQDFSLPKEMELNGRLEALALLEAVLLNSRRCNYSGTGLKSIILRELGAKRGGSRKVLSSLICSTVAFLENHKLQSKVEVDSFRLSSMDAQTSYQVDLAMGMLFVQACASSNDDMLKSMTLNSHHADGRPPLWGIVDISYEHLLLLRGILSLANTVLLSAPREGSHTGTVPLLMNTLVQEVKLRRCLSADRKDCEICMLPNRTAAICEIVKFSLNTLTACREAARMMQDLGMVNIFVDLVESILKQFCGALLSGEALTANDLQLSPALRSIPEADQMLLATVFRGFVKLRKGFLSFGLSPTNASDGILPRSSKLYWCLRISLANYAVLSKDLFESILEISRCLVECGSRYVSDFVEHELAKSCIFVLCANSIPSTETSVWSMLEILRCISRHDYVTNLFKMDRFNPISSLMCTFSQISYRSNGNNVDVFAVNFGCELALVLRSVPDFRSKLVWGSLSMLRRSKDKNDYACLKRLLLMIQPLLEASDRLSFTRKFISMNGVNLLLDLYLDNLPTCLPSYFIRNSETDIGGVVEMASAALFYVMKGTVSTGSLSVLRLLHAKLNELIKGFEKLSPSHVLDTVENSRIQEATSAAFDSCGSPSSTFILDLIPKDITVDEMRQILNEAESCESLRFKERTLIVSKQLKILAGVEFICVLLRKWTIGLIRHKSHLFRRSTSPCINWLLSDECRELFARLAEFDAKIRLNIAKHQLNAGLVKLRSIGTRERSRIIDLCYLELIRFNSTVESLFAGKLAVFQSRIFSCTVVSKDSAASISRISAMTKFFGTISQIYMSCVDKRDSWLVFFYVCSVFRITSRWFDKMVCKNEQEHTGICLHGLIEAKVEGSCSGYLKKLWQHGLNVEDQIGMNRNCLDMFIDSAFDQLQFLAKQKRSDQLVHVWLESAMTFLWNVVSYDLNDDEEILDGKILESLHSVEQKYRVRIAIYLYDFFAKNQLSSVSPLVVEQLIPIACLICSLSFDALTFTDKADCISIATITPEVVCSARTEKISSRNTSSSVISHERKTMADEDTESQNLRGRLESQNSLRLFLGRFRQKSLNLFLSFIKDAEIEGERFHTLLQGVSVLIGVCDFPLVITTALPKGAVEALTSFNFSGFRNHVKCLVFLLTYALSNSYDGSLSHIWALIHSSDEFRRLIDCGASSMKQIYSTERSGCGMFINLLQIISALGLAGPTDGDDFFSLAARKETCKACCTILAQMIDGHDDTLNASSIFRDVLALLFFLLKDDEIMKLFMNFRFDEGRNMIDTLTGCFSSRLQFPGFQTLICLVLSRASEDQNCLTMQMASILTSELTGCDKEKRNSDNSIPFRKVSVVCDILYHRDPGLFLTVANHLCVFKRIDSSSIENSTLMIRKNHSFQYEQRIKGEDNRGSTTVLKSLVSAIYEAYLDSKEQTRLLGFVHLIRLLRDMIALQPWQAQFLVSLNMPTSMINHIDMFWMAEIGVKRPCCSTFAGFLVQGVLVAESYFGSTAFSTRTAPPSKSSVAKRGRAFYQSTLQLIGVLVNHSMNSTARKCVISCLIDCINALSRANGQLHPASMFAIHGIAMVGRYIMHVSTSNALLPIGRVKQGSNGKNRIAWRTVFQLYSKSFVQSLVHAVQIFDMAHPSASTLVGSLLGIVHELSRKSVGKKMMELGWQSKTNQTQQTFTTSFNSHTMSGKLEQCTMAVDDAEFDGVTSRDNKEQSENENDKITERKDKYPGVSMMAMNLDISNTADDDEVEESDTNSVKMGDFDDDQDAVEESNDTLDDDDEETTDTQNDDNLEDFASDESDDFTDEESDQFTTEESETLQLGDLAFDSREADEEDDNDEDSDESKDSDDSSARSDAGSEVCVNLLPDGHLYRISHRSNMLRMSRVSGSNLRSQRDGGLTERETGRRSASIRDLISFDPIDLHHPNDGIELNNGDDFQGYSTGAGNIAASSRMQDNLYRHLDGITSDPFSLLLSRFLVSPWSQWLDDNCGSYHETTNWIESYNSLDIFGIPNSRVNFFSVYSESLRSRRHEKKSETGTQEDQRTECPVAKSIILDLVGQRPQPEPFPSEMPVTELISKPILKLPTSNRLWHRIIRRHIDSVCNPVLLEQSKNLGSSIGHHLLLAFNETALEKFSAQTQAMLSCWLSDLFCANLKLIKSSKYVDLWVSKSAKLQQTVETPEENASEKESKDTKGMDTSQYCSASVDVRGDSLDTVLDRVAQVLSADGVLGHEEVSSHRDTQVEPSPLFEMSVTESILGNHEPGKVRENDGSESIIEDGNVEQALSDYEINDQNTLLPMPPGTDQDVWNSLPVSVRLMVLTEQQIDIPENVLSTISEETRRAYDEEVTALSGPQIPEDHPSTFSNHQDAVPARPTDMDIASVIATIEDPLLRREVLLSTDRHVMEQLPPHLRAEVELLQQHGDAFYGETASHNSEDHAEKVAAKVQVESEIRNAQLISNRDIPKLVSALSLQCWPPVSVPLRNCFVDFSRFVHHRVQILEGLFEVFNSPCFVNDLMGYSEILPDDLPSCSADKANRRSGPPLSSTTNNSILCRDINGKYVGSAPFTLLNRSLSLLRLIVRRNSRVRMLMLFDRTGSSRKSDFVGSSAEFGYLERLLDLFSLNHFRDSSVHLALLINLLLEVVSPMSLLAVEDEKDKNEKEVTQFVDEGIFDDDSPLQHERPVTRRVVKKSHLKSLCSIFLVDSCTSFMFRKLAKIIRCLSRVEQNRIALIEELGNCLRVVAGNVTMDMSNLKTLICRYNKLGSSFYGSQVLFSTTLNEEKLLCLVKITSRLLGSSRKLRDISAGFPVEKVWTLLSECLGLSKLTIQDGRSSSYELPTSPTTELEDISKVSSNNFAVETEAHSSVLGLRLTSRFLAFARARLPIIKALILFNYDESMDFDDGTREKEEEQRRIMRLLDQANIQDRKKSCKADTGIEEERKRLVDEKVERVQELTTSGHCMLTRFVATNSDILNELLYQSPSLMRGAFAYLLRIPQCCSSISFENKQRYFIEAMASQRVDASSSSLRMTIRRNNIFQDSYEFFSKCSPQLLHAPLSIKFEGEDGIDAGGVSREWYELLAREMFKPDYCLFKPSADSSAFQPDSRSSINASHLDYFRFVGQVVGKALADGFLLDAHFTRSFYKHILNRPVNTVDMQSIDPQYYRSLCELLVMDIDDIGIELTFTIDIDEFGAVRSQELFTGGENIFVTEQNKRDYVQLATKHRMTTGIRKQIDAFLSGFNDNVSPELVRIFDENELELLISGMPNIDLDDLKRNTEYNGYTPLSPQIQWFWKALESFSSEVHAKFLMFVTGTSKVPLEGFKGLVGVSGVQKFTIFKASGDDCSLPAAHTCFNQLDLPEFSSEIILKEKCLLAFTEGSEGFELM